MLVTILANLALTGGIVPPTPNDQSGDGFRLRHTYDDKNEKERQLLEEEHENVFTMFQMFIISNN